MDMRVKKTKRSIINAFLELRSKMPLEKIRINERAGLLKLTNQHFMPIIRIFISCQRRWNRRFSNPI